ncbi:MAG TPA: NAD(P)H-hydrate dehydratase [Lacibacter sp.]|nr:NAD(P)H-hydrate dehydratase [Lacibacter sp.]HMO90388.1 NAD(P)H-hydrate dehydratase [Lacibacter sp.]HMP88053.1 NAD(P)H-hydrate dehydratase [Lacibacter sp.]
MKLFTAEQFRAWDAYTISQEPIASIDLMERAATQCADWMLQRGFGRKPVHIFCGKGNNGGDGLALARLLLQQGCRVHCYVLESGQLGTPDFQANLHRLHAHTHDLHFIQGSSFFPALSTGDIVVDALFGTGLNKAPEGISKELLQHLNHSGATGISLDLPSGMLADDSSAGHTVFCATHTLTFQQLKRCFLMPENQDAMGEVQVLPIGLHPDYSAITPAPWVLTDAEQMRRIYRPRPRFAHKGIFGHAFLLAGSRGKMGAAVLAAAACLRSGAGLLSCVVPDCGYPILQSAVPEAMVTPDPHDAYLTVLPSALSSCDAVGIGPGLGLHEETAACLLQLLQEHHRPTVLDADALNLLSIKESAGSLLHADCLLTPHPKEFERLFGPCANDFERVERASEAARRLHCCILVKSHYSYLANPDGMVFFNTTGNPGMATAGSGDVLTGILTGLLAQGYSVEEAALLGMYLHGKAGDLAADQLSEEALVAGDITRFLGNAFRSIS